MLVGPESIDYLATELSSAVFQDLTRVDDNMLVDMYFYNTISKKIKFLNYLPRKYAYTGGSSSNLFTEMTQHTGCFREN